MNFTSWLAGGAVLGFLASTWQKTKAILWRVATLFIQRVEFMWEGYGHESMIEYMVQHYPMSTARDKVLWGCYENIGQRVGVIPVEKMALRSAIFWNGIFPIFYQHERENPSQGNPSGSNNNSSSNSGSDRVTIQSSYTFIRGTFKFYEIFVKACDERNKRVWQKETPQNRFFVKHVPDEEDTPVYAGKSSGESWYDIPTNHLLAHTRDQLAPKEVTKNALDGLIFPKNVTDLIEEIRRWRNHENWYREHAIPWKRGWALYGVPGTGKTALARAFAQDLNMPIFVFNLAMLSNRTLIKEWKKIRGNVPCIALFEDIDNVFHGRNNVCRKNMGMFPMWEDFDQNNSSPAGSGSNGKDDKKFADMSPLTFDCFINCLDGVDRADGIFVIITTNDISKLDPALGVPKNDGSDDCISTRPGRIDKVIELSYMTEDCKIRMAQRILKGCDLELKDMIYFIRNNPDLKETPAQFQERCAQIAIKWWEKQLALQQPKVQKKEIVVRKPPKSLFEGRVSYKWTLLEKETP